MFLRPVPSRWGQITTRNRGFFSSIRLRVSNVSTPAALVDPLSGRKDTHRVYATSEPWDVILNQADINANRNKNKFYIIQLLQSAKNPDSYSLYTRWGRVGEEGQTRLEESFKSVSDAEKMFNKKFKSKTGVEWAERESTTPQDGKYMWLDRQYEADVSDAEKDTASALPSTLAPQVLTLCNIIFSQDSMKAHLAAMNYNAAKYLSRLADVIEDPQGDVAKEYGGAEAAFTALSSAYYSIIPHVSGRFPLRVIYNHTALKEELDLMDSLWDMEVASKIMNSPTHKRLHPMDERFLSLGLSAIAPVSNDSHEFHGIAKYVHDTEVRKSLFDIDVVHVFKVERSRETDAWKSAGHDQLDDGERLLLWHGSRSTNFAGILKNGLRIAPPEAPSSGYMFGRGVYFADMVSKAFNYCHSNLNDNTGLLLLCEVAAAPFYEQINANYDANFGCAVAQKRSTKGLGRSAPTVWTDAGTALANDELRGCMMPEGHKRLRTPQPALNHNEYIVYNLNQVRLRYVVMVKSRDKPHLG
ncbi:PARP-domain-containing protein [Mycena epipterygia]|nr:PARP-domain-containing protein [Mycena epipterygia]